MIDENSDKAKNFLAKIFEELHIKVFICIDDVYALKEGHELAIGWFDKALEANLHNKCIELLSEVPFDGPDEIWKRKLGEIWDTFEEEKKTSIFRDLGQLVGFSNLDRDLERATALKELIPDGVEFRELSPDAWKNDKESIISQASEDNRILCLFDQELKYGSIIPGGGISLLKDQQLSQKNTIVCGLYSHLIRQDSERKQAINFASEHQLRLGKFLLLSKDRLSDGGMKFVTGLRNVILSHTCDFITEMVQDIASWAAEEADSRFKKEIDFYNFNHIVLKSSENEGLWEAETLFRLFELFRRNSFLKKVFEQETRKTLTDKIEQIRRIQGIESQDQESADEAVYNEQRWKIRRQELYEDGEFINKTHLPLELGDIFSINNRSFILLNQPCDVQLRTSGDRTQEIMTLMHITLQESVEQNLNSVSNFLLKYFDPQAGKDACVKFRNMFYISADILDLVVFNDEGVCKYSIDGITSLPSTLHKPLKNRYRKIHNKLSRRYQEFLELNKVLEKSHSKLSTGAQTFLRKSFIRELTHSELPLILKIQDGGTLQFDLQRVGRYKLPDSLRLLSNYVAFLSRDAVDHDFVSLRS